MAISAKSRSRQVLIGEADADSSLNDNVPGVHPGHELSELRNAQRQPAGETVIHYTRFAQISSFPDHPETAPAAPLSAPPMDAAVEKQDDEQKPVRRRLALTCVGSLLFHAGLAVALALFVPKPPNEVIEDAGEAVSVIVFGDSDIDQTSAGDPELELKPDEIAAEEVKPDTVQSTAVTDELRPTETQPQEVTRVSPETVVAAEPEILVSQNPAETFVAQPMATVVPEQPAPDVVPTIVPQQAMTAAVQPVEVQPEEVKPVETAEVSPKPEEKPEPKPASKVEKPKPDKKEQPRKKVEPTGGKNGTDRRDMKRGVTTGQDAPEFNGIATTGGRGDGIGSAAVANYPGKVQKRIRRAIRVPDEYKRMGGAISVRLKLTIDGTGRLSSVSVAGSSGIPDLDKVALDGVRRAAPFPPLPPEWGKASWSFTQEVQVSR
ncbi:energy transducer TonB family protein [Rhizobium leguminosarum]|uniref:Protein TonB n=1 Tax=Rhizobium leguminosarum TaxID=384 RepID=A0A7X0DVJ6_RHILE|nr:TonB family protein [Rhizobium leguminosarum]MBB6224740.1 protein TonB [Rhizobium leguminosarum]